MSQRNSISRTLAAHFDRLLGSSGGALTTAGIVLVALGVVCRMDEATAAASYAAALVLGGLLMSGPPAVRRSSNEPPPECLVEFRRVGMHPVDIVDRNHR